MLGRFVPGFAKRRLKNFIRECDEERADKLYYPSRPGVGPYCLAADAEDGEPLADDGLPIPPPDLWLGYGADARGYLSSGEQHVDEMVRVLEGTDFSALQARRILEFGCGAGRMIRRFPKLAPEAELWGVDISAEHIRWCIDHLSPTIHFATTTRVPHLPFEDGSFDLVFCGSVFTHIEDLQEAWLLELGRILRPSGKLYVTIHDENTVRILDGPMRDYWLARKLREQPIYRANKDHFRMIVVSRGVSPQVFYHSSYFRSIVPPLFRWASHEPEAYGYQSAVVLERR